MCASIVLPPLFRSLKRLTASPLPWTQFLGLFLVVAFGSCMDIAAIQQVKIKGLPPGPRPAPSLASTVILITLPPLVIAPLSEQDNPFKIDYDRELTTVATSNMLTGLVGVGYTGSYIFSQTVFTMRAGVFSRLCGWVVVAVEAALFLLPFSVVQVTVAGWEYHRAASGTQAGPQSRPGSPCGVLAPSIRPLQYLPNFYFGALLLWFGLEISHDWLVLSFYKLSRTEYVLLLATFLATVQLGLELGIGAGIVMATLFFAAAYAKVRAGWLDGGGQGSASLGEHAAPYGE